jgi:hypothetical protein
MQTMPSEQVDLDHHYNVLSAIRRNAMQTHEELNKLRSAIARIAEQITETHSLASITISDIADAIQRNAPSAQCPDQSPIPGVAGGQLRAQEGD